MSINSQNIDQLKKGINKLFLNERLLRYDYSDLFYYHLTCLLKFRLLEHNDLDELKLTEKNYFGLEQFIFENTTVVESENPSEVNWDTIDIAKDILKNKIKSLLKHEANSDTLKPIINFTVDAFENWLIYKQLHPSSISNPWIPTNDILEKGYLFLVSDQRELITNYNKKAYDKVENKNFRNIGVITKSKREKDFSGFIIDNRNNMQSLVYEYMKREAIGVNKAIDSKKISNFLDQQDYHLKPNDIRNKITIPLKRAGLIGSTTSGFFYIQTIEDLHYTILHHEEKLNAIQKTIDIYKELGKKRFNI